MREDIVEGSTWKVPNAMTVPHVLNIKKNPPRTCSHGVRPTSTGGKGFSGVEEVLVGTFSRGVNGRSDISSGRELWDVVWDEEDIASASASGRLLAWVQCRGMWLTEGKCNFKALSRCFLLSVFLPSSFVFSFKFVPTIVSCFLHAMLPTVRSIDMTILATTGLPFC
jgi:hypothetical protein